MWHDVPENKMKKWIDTFQSSKEILKLSKPCPLCGEPGLYRYYHLHRIFDSPSEYPGFVGRGGLWEWCEECRHYMHYSASVPIWWDCDIKIDADDLYHDPENISRAINQHENGGR